jgi:hypothetical protein
MVGIIILIAIGCTVPTQQATPVPTRVTQTPAVPVATQTEKSVSPSATATQPASETALPSPTGDTSAPSIRLDAPLSLGLLEGVDYDFLQQHLRSDDYVVVHVRNVKSLDRVSGTKRLLILTPEDVKNMQRTLALAESQDIDMISYNLEGQLTVEDLVAGSSSVYEQVKDAGIPFMFGPTLNHLARYYADLAPHADAIIIQSQRMQTSDDYGENVKELIANLKAANPDLEVWVQISIVPPPDREVPVETVLKEIESIADSVDGLFLFYTMDRWDEVKEIITAVRP